MPQVKIFRKDDEGYLSWVQANPDGYVVNLDDPLTSPMYPMVHRASHRVISSPARSNYTTGRYIKYCGLDLIALEAYVQAEHQRSLTQCSQCM